MIRELIMDEALQQGMQQGLQEGRSSLLVRQLAKKYQRASEEFQGILDGLRSEDLLELGEYMLDCESYDDILTWIQQHRQGNLS